MILTTYLIVKDMAASLAFYKAFFQKEPFGGCPDRFSIFSGDNNTSLALYNPLFDDELIRSGKDLREHFNDAYLDGKEKTVKYGSNIVINIGVENLSEEYERIKMIDITALTFTTQTVIALR